ncbi:MAG: ABC transporter permease, partial [Candidatus Methylomirabilis sp.]
MNVIDFWISHRAEMLGALGQHVVLVLVATATAIGIGVPLGIIAARRPRLGAPLLLFANIVQTVPSLAMFGFLVAVPLVGGIGARSALIVLFLYALLPVMRNTVAGVQGIDRGVRSAGVAMGMTARQLLLQVELPLAMPTIVAGVRVAAVVGVGAATIAAAIGAGGLGDYIFRGLSMTDPTVI